MRYLVCFSFFITSLALAAENERAPNACFEALTKCFSSEGVQKSNCFYTTAGNSECTGTEEGKLVYKRWALSTSTTVGGETPPGLLGPILYDDSCIAKCDTEWMSEIVAKSEISSVIKKIKNCFVSCKKPESLEVLRP